MVMPLLIVDDGAGRLGPMTELRPASELRTGARVTRERLERAAGSTTWGLYPPPCLAEVTAERLAGTGLRVNPPSRDLPAGPCLVMHARAGRWTTQVLPEPGVVIKQADGAWAAFAADAAVVRAWLDQGLSSANQAWRQAPHGLTDVVLPPGVKVLIDRPWQVLDGLEATLVHDLGDDNRWPGFAAPAGGAGTGGAAGQGLPHRSGGHKLHVGAGASFACAATNFVNLERGPVVIDAGAHIGAMAVLEGPCYIGPGTVVAHHASIRPFACVGPGCKVAGELSFCVVQGNTNKAHHGYLGHAYLGEWCNLGAATNASNLKNTYGNVRMQVLAGEKPEDSGRVFMGPVLGDYVRTAVGTKLPTGACVGAGAMLAVGGFAPKFAPCLTFHTDDGVAPAEMPKLLKTLGVMHARRNQPLGPALQARLLALAQG